MPSAFPATVAEREAELQALQSAFDEYIASSRELEEELDAELAKMQEKLAESTAANAALSAQLENIAPQLSALEKALTESRLKLKEEQRLRRAAEQAQDEADQRVREMDLSLQQIREECDLVHEELAFKENELEETKLELDIDKQQLQNELNKLKSDLAVAQRAAARNNSLMDQPSVSDNKSVETPVPTLDHPPSSASSMVDENYVKKLEEELELVTEQLIETEKRLSELEAHVAEKDARIGTLEQGQSTSSEDVEETVQVLKMEVADHLEAEQKLRDELASLKEEYKLVREENALQQEELQAAEEDCKAVSMKLEEERVRHREEVNQLSIQLKEAEIASRSSLSEAALVATTVRSASDENEKLSQEIAALEQALANSKKDYQSVLDELDAVNSRFDQVRSDAEQAGRQAALEEMRSVMKTDTEHEMKKIKDELEKLAEENRSLEQKVYDAEIALAAAKDNRDQNVGGAEEQSELVKQLQVHLQRAKEDLAKKDAEMAALTSSMEERLTKAEESVTRLESELLTAKGQLAESEARLIVLRREKDRSDNMLVKSPKRAQPTYARGGTRGLDVPDLDREELAGMESTPSVRQVKTSARNRSRSSSPSSVMRLEYRLSEETQKLEKLQKEYDSLQDQKRMGEVRIKRLEADLSVLQKQLFAAQGDTAVVTQMTRLSSLASTDKGMDIITDDDVKGTRLKVIIESQDIKRMADELRALEKKCNSQREYNAQLLSKMLHLQGNIQVYCRIRPMTISELQKGYKGIAEPLSETEVGCFDSRTNKWKSFAFDRVWGPDQSQQSVFQDVEPLALSVVDGFNACIFAYGQTGSGKTFTMEGMQENNQFGISYRTIQKIFHLLNLRAQQQRAAELFVEGENESDPAEEISFHFSIKIGMLEIYNEEIYDLLATQGASLDEKKQEAMRAGGKASLEIRRSKDGRIEVPNLTQENVSTIQEVMGILKRGNSNRATATTDMNEHSSRSHMVLIVDVTSGLAEADSNKGTLYLVDLAGSERVRKSNVSGDQLKEAGFINKSLSALGNVMEALDRKASHVPYRDSKLTYMLQDSLGGNSRTMMIVTICPMDDSYDESIHALQFATRVRRIQIGAAQRNVTSKNLEETVKALTEEMRALTRAKERTENQLQTLKRDNTRVQEKLQNLSKSKAQSRNDSKTLDMLRKNNDDMAARWQKEKTAREEQAEELENARKELRNLQQQLNKQTTKMQMLEQKLEEKEGELQEAGQLLRQERTDKTVNSVRARRDQVLSARNRVPDVVSSPSKVSTPSAANRIDTSEKDSRSLSSTQALADADQDVEVMAIRAKVLDLLEKHDKAKVDRIDIIMDKFKGKEALLLEKMTQRYEAGSGNASLADSVAKRNEMAMQRHHERMQRIREKKQNGSGPANY